MTYKNFIIATLLTMAFSFCGILSGHGFFTFAELTILFWLLTVSLQVVDLQDSVNAKDDTP